MKKSALKFTVAIFMLCIIALAFTACGIFGGSKAEVSIDGIIYTLNSDGTAYTVTDVDSSIYIFDAVIADECNGLPVTSIGEYAFYYCRTLTSVTIPDSITSINAEAFNMCSNLARVTIGNGVTNIGSNAFKMCTSLASVYISDITKWCAIDFANATSNPLCYTGKLYLNNELVTDLVIPEGVTSIGNYAFYRSWNLTSITIPDSVTSIGNYAFRDCLYITGITFDDTSTWYKTESEGDWSNKTGGQKTDVTNAGTNASYFIDYYGSDDYHYYYWYKTD